jgi:hypothetical protein
MLFGITVSLQEAFMLPRYAIAVPVLALLVGCARGPSPVASAIPSMSPLTIQSIAGVYHLVGIDGRALPTAPAPRSREAESAWPIVGGTFEVRPNGTFLIETSYDTKAQGAQSFESKGSCFPIGGGFRMVWDGGGETPLSARGDTLVVNREGSLYSYLRR